MTLAVWLDYNSRPDSILRAWYWRLLFLIAAFAIPIFCGYLRLVVAAHGIDQVLFGLLLGVWFALSAHFIIRDWLIKLAGDLIQAIETRLLRIALVASGVFLITIGL